MRRASILPEVPEPFTGKLGVPNGVLDVLVPEVLLQGPRVLAVIGEFETAGMAEHVGVHAEWHLRGLPEPRNHSVKNALKHGCGPANDRGNDATGQIPAATSNTPCRRSITSSARHAPRRRGIP
jgi:hypothetical protein